jgi:hypothetical protein
VQTPVPCVPNAFVFRHVIVIVWYPILILHS